MSLRFVDHHAREVSGFNVFLHFRAPVVKLSLAQNYLGSLAGIFWRLCPVLGPSFLGGKETGHLGLPKAFVKAQHPVARRMAKFRLRPTGHLSKWRTWNGVIRAPNSYEPFAHDMAVAQKT